MHNLKISTKLILLVVLTAVTVIITGLYGIRNLEQNNAYLESVYKDRVIPLQQLKIISDNYAVNIVDATHKMYNNNISFAAGKNMIRQAKSAISNQWEIYLSTQLTDEEKRFVNEARSLMKTADLSILNLESIVATDDSISRAQLKDYIINHLYQEIDPITKKIGQMVELQLVVAEEQYQKANQVLWAAEINSVILIIVAILLAVGISMYIIKGINSKISNAISAVTRISKGELNFDLDTGQKDEIGILMVNLSHLKVKMNQVVTQISAASENILSASMQMNASSQGMAQGANEQASSAEEVSSSMEEMASNIQQNTDNAQQTEKISLQAANEIMEGNKAVAQTSDSMKSIAEKISIIGAIARQTNILALNAAVEAARAGEHGKGFAVVAAEVRSLAERSQEAAGEIDQLSKTSVEVAEKSGKLLQEIVPNIQKTAQLVQEISSASMEQNSGADQINNAIQQLNQITQQNAASSEEMATSSEELSSQAEQLKEIVGYFTISENARNTFSSERHANEQVKLKYNMKKPEKKIEME